MAIQEVKSDSGVTAWLVEDYTLPLITINFAFGGGSTQDPAGKEGLATLMSGLFDEGAGDLDSDTFQSRLDDAGAEMRFSAGQDTISGSMRMLANERREAFDLLALAVNKPRFDAEPVARIKAQLVSSVASRSRDPDQVAQVRWSEAVFPDHPYARQDDGTELSLNGITPDDLRAAHQAMFARSNLKVSVVGAIDAETLKQELNHLFGALPQDANLKSVAKVEPRLAQQIEVGYDLPQTSIRLAYPGIPRDDPQSIAAYLMNYILGGGDFSSRLYNEVREKRGLAYGINSGMMNQKYADALVIGTATRSDRASETLGIIRDVVRQLAEQGPTQQELADAKKYVLGAYAINNLDSSSAIASTLLQMQIFDMGIDYMQRRVKMIDDVTLDDVKSVAKRLLSAEPAVMIVGPPLSTEKQG
ncbi:MAG: insulinase family protein [Rhizobiaceae bacterium]|nr:insulinase family protein [Rhizobiaceae bacterium]